MNKTPDELWAEARAVIEQMQIPDWCKVEYVYTASRPHRPCVRLSRVFDGEWYEASLVLPWTASALRHCVEQILERSSDEWLRQKKREATV